MTIGEMWKKRARRRAGPFGGYSDARDLERALLARMDERIAKEFAGDRRAYLTAIAPELLWEPKAGGPSDVRA